MNKFIAAVTIAAAIAAAPATAVNIYSAVGSFNGVNGNGGFSYGYTGGAALTAFDAGQSGGCVFNATSVCLYSSAHANIPQASLGGGGVASVTVPTNAIILHPGDADDLAVYTGFAATSTSTYTYTINLQSIGTDSATGVGYTPFTAIGGVVTLGTRGTLVTPNAAVALTGTQVLTAGQTFGVIVDRNGTTPFSYGGDSTTLNFTISNVPEPATWGLLFAGFAMVGLVARRRQTSLAA